jgi:hypothetical protein
MDQALVIPVTQAVWESNIPTTMPSIPAITEIIFAKPPGFFLKQFS